MRLRKCSMKREEIIAAGPAHCDAGFVFGMLGNIFAILGAYSDVANVTLGLEPTSWLLLAIFAGLTAISSWIAWVLAVHLDAMEARSKKED